MTQPDSPIIDFYPETFQIDMNGKKMAWQGVALLPFIDEKRLLEAMATEYPKISEEETMRNARGFDVVFAARDHPIYPFYEQLYGKRKNNDVSIFLPFRVSWLTTYPTQTGCHHRLPSGERPGWVSASQSFVPARIDI